MSAGVRATSKREGFAWMVLPAAALLAAHVLFLRPRATSELHAAQTRLAEARADAPPADLIARLSAKRTELEAELAAVRTALQPSVPGTEAEIGSDERALALGRLSEILLQHELTLCEQGSREVPASELPPALRPRVRSGSGLTACRLRFRGGYFAVVDALQTLTAAGGTWIPLELEFDTAPGGEESTWTLLIS